MINDMITYISELKQGDIFALDGGYHVLVEYDESTNFGFVTSIDNYIFVEIRHDGVYGYTNGSYIKMDPKEKVDYVCSLVIMPRKESENNG